MSDSDDTSVSAVDLQDARAIRLAFAALEESSNPRSGPTNAVRRWILNNVWFVPRGAYTHPRWSVAARADPVRANITYEHVVPISRVRAELQSGPQTDEAYAETMSTLLVMAVVTKAEDRRLSKYKSTHPQDVITDVWARYREVGIVMDETPGPTLDPEHDLPAVPDSLLTNEENGAAAETPSAEDLVATWIVDSPVPAVAKQDTTFGQEGSYANGLRNSREAKGFSRVAVSIGLGISTDAWWQLENEESIGTEQHRRTMAAIAGLAAYPGGDTMNYSNHWCSRCDAEPGEPCRTKDNTPTPKPHGSRVLGGFLE